MKYVMVTTRQNHWDRIGNKSEFPYSMLRGRIIDPNRIEDHAPAVFIRLDMETKLPTKCWEGEMYRKTRTESKIWFEFRLFREITCPQKYVGYPEGWYSDDAAT